MRNHTTTLCTVIVMTVTPFLCGVVPMPAAIVPRPVEMQAGEGAFMLSSTTPLMAVAEAADEARKLQAALAPATGWQLAIAAGGEPRDGAITLVLDAGLSDLGDEGYRLEVTPARIAIRAAKPAGLFYGGRTLLQLLPPAIFRKAPVQGVGWRVPAVTIKDQPRFAWRGLMVDTARHFVPREALLDFIDTMALHKFNRLHLHLTDDQGWRIEIRKYPKLTQVGAWRKETVVGHAAKKPPVFDGRPHGGFYTQDDIREIVRYAADRHITVMPEIEMPGHGRAAIAAYPELGCHPDQPIDIWTTFGVCPDIYNPSDKTVAFLQDVLSEVVELFPSTFIHIGGDEAIKDQWKASPVVQARIKELGLKNEDEMQSWFIHQMDKFLQAKGRRLIGWDEILEGGLAPGATVMSWRGEKGGIAAAKAGHDVVMTPTTHTYFDYCQGPRETEPLAIGGDLSLEKVYSYEPIPTELTADEARHVLGAQGQLWSEYIPNQRHLEYMAWPRAAALAEVVWSPKGQRDLGDFKARLTVHLGRLDVLDVNYRPLTPRQ